ncbi:nuclear transcription factor Y subunit B-5-like [Diospyros lotus]|uniref:nuclear transcription factor Y subunit B-5-like n=1 Tax=Diospyros lotus TaxID=55363 RepID=UPI0022545D5B|nr:nuclear transcription factor Y subunit B-5-like [Diospyros lotus]
MVDNIDARCSSTHEEDGYIKEQDLLLPIANVARIMKQNLPSNAKIAKEAKETMQECVSEFISFVTSEASEKCKKERRKTVNGDDVCRALCALGFDEYAGPLKRYLDRYRELEGDRANQDRISNSEEKEEAVSDRNQAESSTDQRMANSSKSRP